MNEAPSYVLSLNNVPFPLCVSQVINVQSPMTSDLMNRTYVMKPLLKTLNDIFLGQVKNPFLSRCLSFLPK